MGEWGRVASAPPGYDADPSCARTCEGDTCIEYTCDPGYCRQPEKYTNCNHICW